MSPRKITFAGRVAASESSDEIVGRRSRGPESTWSPSQARAWNRVYVTAIEGLLGDTWKRKERLIFVVDWSSGIVIVIFIGRHWDLIKSNGWSCAEDFHAIVAHPWCNRGTRSPHLGGPRLPWNRGHQSASIPGSNGQDFRAKIPFKNWCIPSYFLTLDWIMKELSDLKERSWVLRDPPAFRLNFDQNRSGIDHEFHRISSNFPLERRTSTRKKSS